MPVPLLSSCDSSNFDPVELVIGVVLIQVLPRASKLPGKNKQREIADQLLLVCFLDQDLLNNSSFGGLKMPDTLKWFKASAGGQVRNSRL